MSERKKSREIDDALSESGKIDKDFIIDTVFRNGAPDQGLFARPILWRLFLDYLPYDKKEWNNILKESRDMYHNFEKDLITNPFQKMFPTKKENSSELSSDEMKNTAHMGSKKNVCTHTVTVGHDPLSLLSSTPAKKEEQNVPNEWAMWDSDNQKRVQAENLTVEQVRQAAKERKKKEEELQEESLFGQKKEIPDVFIIKPPKSKSDECHHDVLERILFIYAKLNPGIKYVQGMNEILAPLYFVFANDRDDNFKQYAEADAFFCFTNLMSYIRDRFIRTLDDSASGIMRAVTEVNNILNIVDNDVCKHLRNLSVDPRFYSFRWLTLLLSQEFMLPDVLRLWDSLFADTNKFEFLNYVCVSMIILLRDDILKGTFSDCMQALQREPIVDIIDLLQLGIQVRQAYTDKNPLYPPIRRTSTSTSSRTSSISQSIRKRTSVSGKTRADVKNMMRKVSTSINHSVGKMLYPEL